QITLNEMLERSQLGARAKLLFGPLIHRKAKSSKPVGIEQFDPRNLTGLRDLINFTKEKNIKLILSDTGYGTGDYELVKEFARENAIPFADYKPDLKSVTAAVPGLAVYNSHSGGHFRPWVNFIIASKFAAILESDNR
ncbi:MAG: hypothetical protein PHN59_07520, partial [Candidatus Omnitrophica bacterium]|nr:hypothetical protein [Candidatus Omnitrophota bacterium]